MATRMQDKAMTASTRLAPISRSAPIADSIRLLLAAGKPMPRTLMQQLARHIPALQIEHVKTGHDAINRLRDQARSEEHTSELQSLMRISYAVLCLQKQNKELESNRLK